MKPYMCIDELLDSSKCKINSVSYIKRYSDGNIIHELCIVYNYGMPLTLKGISIKKFSMSSAITLDIDNDINVLDNDTKFRLVSLIEDMYNRPIEDLTFGKIKI